MKGPPANPAPAAATHHTALEVAWTAAPVMILIVIAIPSFRLLTHQLVVPRAGMTMKVSASNAIGLIPIRKTKAMIQAAGLKPGDIRRLSMANEAVVPAGKIGRVEVTASTRFRGGRTKPDSSGARGHPL